MNELVHELFKAEYMVLQDDFSNLVWGVMIEKVALKSVDLNR